MEKRYGIIARTMSEDQEVIELVRIGLADVGNCIWIVQPIILKREDVVNVIANNTPATYTIITDNNTGNHIWGAKVNIYSRRTEEKRRINNFIRTNLNEDDTDNLENLPDCPAGSRPIPVEQVPDKFFMSKHE